MPLPFFGRRDGKIRRRMESYRGWSVVDGNGNELGRVASMEYRIEEGDGKTKVIITGLSVSRNGEESKYSAKDYVIKINDEERVIVVKPKNELESTINEVKLSWRKQLVSLGRLTTCCLSWAM